MPGGTEAKAGISAVGLTRRGFVLGAPLALAACQTSLFSPAAAIYGPVRDGEFLIPAVDLRNVHPGYYRATVLTPVGLPGDPGNIVIDPRSRYLYHLQEDGMATRYGIGVGRDGFAWDGTASVQRKAEWPRWTPPPDMIARDPSAAIWAGGQPGGLTNPLGARALYLYQGGRDTLYRIHGTPEAWSIGRAVSSGCVRMLNQDIIHLYDNTRIGTRVIVMEA